MLIDERLFGSARVLDGDASRSVMIMDSPSIFISYRRSDSASIAGRISDHLVNAFGSDIFLDVESLYSGQDWVNTIEQRIRQSDAVIVVIGLQWLAALDSSGAPRLWNPIDPVRRELEFANHYQKIIIPVCINGAPIPSASQLPESLHFLPNLNVQPLTDADFNYGITRLIQSLAYHGLRQVAASQYMPPPLPAVGDPLPAPAPLPPGSHLPFPRNAAFTDRHDMLLDLARDLLLAPGAIVEPVVLAGSGGIGKTQLAVEFCYRYGQFFHGVHWLQADQELSAQIARCGQAMNLQPWSEKTPEQVALTLQAWQRQPQRLVILDNLTDPALLAQLPVEFRSVKLIVTARRAVYDPTLGLHSCPLTLLPRSDSLALLRKLAPRLAQSPDALLSPLANRLGDYPLALHLAGMYLNQVQFSTPATYLKQLDQPGRGLEQAFLAEWKKTNPTRYEHNASQAFGISWDALDPTDAVDALAARFFLAAGYAAPHAPIPFELFIQLGGEAADDLVCTLALDRLQTLGLVSLVVSGPVLHPLLAEFARLQDGAGGHASFPKYVQALALLAGQALLTGLPSVFLPYLPHLRAALAYPLADTAARATLLNELGQLQMLMGEFKPARPYLEQALALRREILGENHAQTAESYNNLGSLLRALGDYEKAQAALEQALDIRKNLLGEGHPDTATSLNNLGYLLQVQGDDAAARPYVERALDIRREALGEDHPLTVQSYSNLGGLLFNLGDYAAARPYLEQALERNRSILGEHSPATARSLNLMGRLLQALGDFPGARACFEQALALNREVLGEKHLSSADSLANLGQLLLQLGDHPGARDCFEQARAIYESTLGLAHPGTQKLRALAAE